FLARLGFACDAVVNASQALDLLRSAALAGRFYDVAYFGHRPPVLDAMKLVQTVREDSRLSMTRVAVGIALLDRREVDSTWDNDFVCYLSRPVRTSALRDWLSNAVPRTVTVMHRATTGA